MSEAIVQGIHNHLLSYSVVVLPGSWWRYADVSIRSLGEDCSNSPFGQGQRESVFEIGTTAVDLCAQGVVM